MPTPTPSPTRTHRPSGPRRNCASCFAWLDVQVPITTRSLGLPAQAKTSRVVCMRPSHMQHHWHRQSFGSGGARPLLLPLPCGAGQADYTRQRPRGTLFCSVEHGEEETQSSERKQTVLEDHGRRKIILDLGVRRASATYIVQEESPCIPHIEEGQCLLARNRNACARLSPRVTRPALFSNFGGDANRYDTACIIHAALPAVAIKRSPKPVFRVGGFSQGGRANSATNNSTAPSSNVLPFSRCQQQFHMKICKPRTLLKDNTKVPDRTPRSHYISHLVLPTMLVRIYFEACHTRIVNQHKYNLRSLLGPLSPMLSTCPSCRLKCIGFVPCSTVKGSARR